MGTAEVNIALQFQTKSSDQKEEIYKNKKNQSTKGRRHFSRTSSESSESDFDMGFTDFAPPFRRFSSSVHSEQLEKSFIKPQELSTKYYITSLYDNWINQGCFKGVILGYNIINSTIERQTYLAHDLISKLGWLDEPENLWKYRSRRHTNRVPGLCRLSRFSMIDFWAIRGLCLSFLGLLFVCFNLTSIKKSLSIISIILSLSLVSRALILTLWTRRINCWIQMFNQFVEIYSEMDQQSKRGISWFQEIELVSKGFRKFNHFDDVSLSDPNKGDILLKVYEVLNQSLGKFDSAQVCLIEKFPNHLSSIRTSIPETRTAYYDEISITLNEVKLQLEQCYQSRANFLTYLFSLMSEQYLHPKNMSHVLESLQFTGQQLTGLSYSGNAYAIQILSFLEPRSSHPSRKPSLSGFNVTEEKSVSNGETNSSDDIKLSQALRSLSTLEFEMRTWHAQLHLFNQSFGSRDGISPKTFVNQFQHLVKDIKSIASDADATIRHLKEWSAPVTDSMANSQPSSPEPDSISLIFEEDSPKPYILEDVQDQDPLSLLRQQEDVFEAEVIPSPIPEFKPLSLEDRKKRQENFKREQQQRQERQAAFLGMTQELGDAIRNHANFRHNLKQLPAEEPKLVYSKTQ